MTKSKNIMKVNLPVQVEFDDYHEVASFQDNLRLIIPKVKVKEIGYIAGGTCAAIVYVGSLKDPKNQKLFKEIYKLHQEYESRD